MQSEVISQVLESKIFRLKAKRNFSNIILICIGSNKVVGDSFGPMVGSYLLKSINSKKIYIIGSLNNPITYFNYNKTFKEIKKKFSNPCVISVDAAMGNIKNIGDVLVGWGNIEIGKALNKKIVCESDIYVKGIVANNTNDKIKNFNILNSINSEYIRKISLDTSEGIIKSLYNFY